MRRSHVVVDASGWEVPELIPCRLVVDPSGAVIPGADVLVKNNANGVEARAVTDSAGRFVVPGLIPGTYTLKVSLMGFKTFVSPDVKMLAATPATLRATLEVGALEETVVVKGATEILQTQSAAVQTTLQVKQIQQLPLSTRTALDYIVSLPGLNTSGSNNTRGSTINGASAPPFTGTCCLGACLCRSVTPRGVAFLFLPRRHGGHRTP